MSVVRGWRGTTRQDLTPYFWRAADFLSRVRDRHGGGFPSGGRGQLLVFCVFACLTFATLFLLHVPNAPSPIGLAPVIPQLLLLPLLSFVRPYDLFLELWGGNLDGEWLHEGIPPTTDN